MCWEGKGKEIYLLVLSRRAGAAGVCVCGGGNGRVKGVVAICCPRRRRRREEDGGWRMEGRWRYSLAFPKLVFPPRM